MYILYEQIFSLCSKMLYKKYMCYIYFFLFRYVPKYFKMYIESTRINLQQRRKTNLIYRYGYVLLMLICMIFASIQPHIGGTNGN